MLVVGAEPQDTEGSGAESAAINTISAYNVLVNYNAKHIPLNDFQFNQIRL